nr:cytochrome c biogenesis protein ResB [Murinocardiopsis flavida]
MRTALVLLFLLAIGAIPGSLLPQRTVSVEQVQNYFVENPDLAPWLDRFALFDVYSSPWYSAIYLLLFVSLTGCVLPRAAVHIRAMRARPPKTPRHLNRMPYAARFTTAASPEDALAAARTALKRYRTDEVAETGGGSIAAEKGYLRETGNVLFHFALLALLISLGIGSFFGYRGNMVVIEGEGFANTPTSFDAFHPGTAIGPEDLQPFSFSVEDFQAEFIQDGRLNGQALSFSADLSYQESPEAPQGTHKLEVNHPLSVDGAQVYLLGRGYAPAFKVTDSEGNVVYDQAVPFIYRDEATFTSDGVVKVPDSVPEQLGFTAVFLPSAAESENGMLVSDFPDDRNPVITLQGYKGDLGIDSGEAQSVYQLDTDDMKKVGKSPEMKPGDVWELPDGSGKIEFTGVKDHLSMQVNSNPGRIPALLSAAAAVLGLIATLFVRPRRAWVRARTGEDGRTVVEVAGLAKADTSGAATEFHELSLRVRADLRASERSDAADEPSGPESPDSQQGTQKG